MDPAKYGLGAVPAGSHVVVTDLVTGASLGTYTSTITYSASVPAFGVQLLKLVVGK
jgi:hypothetical protein